MAVKSPEDVSPLDSEDGDGPEEPRRNNVFLKHMIAASISAAIAETINCPADRVKVILQVQALRKTIVTGTRKEVQAGRGIIECFRIIISQQGFLGLWRGNSAALFYAMPNQAFTLVLKDKITSILTGWFGKGPKKKSVVHAFVIGCTSGSMAGACMTSLLYPLDYARTNMAADMSKRGKARRRTVLAVLASTYRNFGIRAVYRGLPFSVLGIIIYRGCYFGIFDLGMRLTPSKYRRNVVGQILPAFSAASGASLCAYPLDTIRRNVMLRKDREGKDTIGHVARKIYAKTGIRGFYAGSVASQFRSIGAGVMLVSYTSIKSALASL